MGFAAGLPLYASVWSWCFFKPVDVGEPVYINIVCEVVDIFVNAISPGGSTVPPNCPVKERYSGTFGFL